MTTERQTPKDVDPLARQLMTHAQLLSSLRRDLDTLASEATDAVADLLTRLDELESAQPTTTTPAAWCWRSLGPKGRDELWRQLIDWVGWLRSRYPLARVIPECWAEHPEIVEELTALWLAWQQAYEERDPSLTAPAEWHDRWLPGLLHRLQHGPFALECSTHHCERPASAYGPTQLEYDDDPSDDTSTVPIGRSQL